MKTSAEEEVKEEVESGVGQKPLLSEELNKSTHRNITKTLSKGKCKGEEFMHQVYIEKRVTKT